MKGTEQMTSQSNQVGYDDQKTHNDSVIKLYSKNNSCKYNHIINKDNKLHWLTFGESMNFTLEKSIYDLYKIINETQCSPRQKLRAQQKKSRATKYQVNMYMVC